ncbi:hypothetical protein [Vibrio owensii]|uniref:Uncharacterized protein n=1 Tax=Vibrio owensii CAIM 1854 = LMG 25443 TaxID=1229493 RepID=A0A0C1YXV1_9VIBR|nr:hypothetical protein [Vibrio owensii]KIF45321.1 hypothetical protein H735_29725 [Vibrio owensii CAIM 1854 = LMG 25443]
MSNGARKIIATYIYKLTTLNSEYHAVHIINDKGTHKVEWSGKEPVFSNEFLRYIKTKHGLEPTINGTNVRFGWIDVNIERRSNGES